MNQIYTLNHRLVACILLFEFFLQSCGGQNQLVPQEKKQISRILELSGNPLTSADKEIITSGGYLASFYEEDGDLKADLKADEKQPNPNYKGLPVLVEEGIDLASLTKLDLKTQQQRIELNRSHNGQLSHITIRKGGLSGGMMEEDDYPEKGKQKEKKKRLKERKKEYRIVTGRVKKGANKKIRRSGSGLDTAKQPFYHRRSRSVGDTPLNIPLRLPIVEKNETEATNMQVLRPPVAVNSISLHDKKGDSSLDLSEAVEEEAKAQGSLHFVEENEKNEEDEEEIRPNLLFSSDEEKDDDFVILSPDHGSRLRLNQLEGESFMEDILIQEILSKKYLQLLKINPQDLTPEEIEDLEEILKVEGGWKNYLIWANLTTLIHKTLFALTTNKHAINKRKQKAFCAPLWLHGGPIPLDSSSAIKRNIILKTLGSSLEEGSIESLHTVLLALMGYQLYEVVDSKTFSCNLSFFANFYKEADAVSYLGIIKKLHDSPALFALLATPFVFAIAKTLYTYSQISEPTDTAVDETVKSLRNRSRKWDWIIFNITSTIFDVTSNIISITPFLSSLLHLHPLKRILPALTSVILWEGRLSPEARENAFTAILELARTRKGFSKMAAIESLYHLAHGMNIRNLIQRPHDVEDLLHIKLRAFRALKEIYRELPTCSLNKFRTAALLWEMGQSPSWFISIIEPINKALRAALYAYTIYGIFDVLYKYFTCPYEYLDNFTWVGGLEPYASDYSKECFDAQVAAFNTLPGQPASTLVGDLGHYHFTEPYDLDLSNKGIQGPVIADIVEGFKHANIPLRSLNASYNMIANTSSIARILNALPPEIIQLDLSNLNPLNLFSTFSPSDFLGLGKLVGLQSLNISNNGLNPQDIGVIGQEIKTLPQLKELRLARKFSSSGPTNITQIAHSLKASLTLLDLTSFTLFTDLEGQIALGNSLVKLPNLEQLYLGEVGIGGSGQNTTLSKAAISSLARGIQVQQNLRVLDLSNNNIGDNGDIDIILLSSLPASLTHLDVSLNNIGSYYSDQAEALAQAVQQMSGLTSFIGGLPPNDSNTLCNFPDFLNSFQNKQNLTTLIMSANYCNNVTLIRNLLQTTPNLKTLDLSSNGLTNGSVLAPVLSTLSKLRILNLMGNPLLTTADQISIWRAVSPFVRKSPFRLDDDFNYTQAYLGSFPSTTFSLDLSGLISWNYTAFETIMPQIVNLFPNLTELDLSNNKIFTTDSNNITIISGIQALTTYLPKLTHLQTLRLSDYSNYIPVVPNLPVELINFPQIIAHLPNLKTIDFSDSTFIFAGSLAKGIENSHSLSSINLSGCWSAGLPPDTWQEGKQLVEGLQKRTNLTYLDLSNNPIGETFLSGNKDPNSTIFLSKTLTSWPYLQYLNLANTYIGYQDPSSSSIFLDNLAELAAIISKQGRALEVNLLNGISNVEWTQGAGVLQKLTQQKIKDACALQLCTGYPISKPTSSETQDHNLQANILETALPTATSNAISSHYIPWYSPASWITAWKSWWKRPTQPIDMTNLQVEELTRFKERCECLINKTDARTADRWYRFSLEDLLEDVEKSVNNPVEVSEDTIKDFYRRLKAIERDFLRQPLLKKPSFFATSYPLTTPLSQSNNIIDLCFFSRPLLESNTALISGGIVTEAYGLEGN